MPMVQLQRLYSSLQKMLLHLTQSPNWIEETSSSGVWKIQLILLVQKFPQTHQGLRTCWQKSEKDVRKVENQSWHNCRHSFLPILIDQRYLHWQQCNERVRHFQVRLLRTKYSVFQISQCIIPFWIDHFQWQKVLNDEKSVTWTFSWRVNAHN